MNLFAIMNLTSFISRWTMYNIAGLTRMAALFLSVLPLCVCYLYVFPISSPLQCRLTGAFGLRAGSANAFFVCATAFLG